MMAMRQDYSTGWIDTSVHNFLATIDTPPSNMAYSLITSLDSCLDLPTIVSRSPAFQRLQAKCRIVGEGILLPTRQLIMADRRERIFFGFDEIWFFPTATVSPKPSGVSLTGPTAPEGESLRAVFEWMEAARCQLGLGDGTGMNFCAKLRGIAAYLVRAFEGSTAHEIQKIA